MLALLASNAPPIRDMEGYMTFAVIPVALIAASLYHLYQEAFPSLEGSHQSLLYFREIAGRTETDFIAEFASQNKNDYARDLLIQIWHNSVILRKKYDHLKGAFILLAWSVVPWMVSLAMFAAKNTELKTLLAK
jgi:hypothetical protein